MKLGFWKSRGEEKRLLRIKVETLQRAHTRQKEKSNRLKQENTQLKKELKEARLTIIRLEEKIQDLEIQRDRYREMVFKKNVEVEEDQTEESTKEEDKLLFPEKKRKRGARPGHRGYGRKKPEHIDEIKRVCLSHCPDCGTKLTRSNEICSHTVEDIVALEKSQTQVTRYDVERQWCGVCKKKVSAKPMGIIPHCRLGINLLLYVLIQKYGAKNSWETIVFNLQVLFGVVVSKSALVEMVHRVRQWLGWRYVALLENIRGSPIKHADETSWRIDGINHWLWGFFTPSCAYYTIEESRGKGVPQKILAGSHEDDVLIRDDYAAYTKLPLKQQSCWSHLLRKSREAAEDPRALPEVKDLHTFLKTMFVSLQELLAKPYIQAAREAAYKKFKGNLEQIIHTNFHSRIAREIRMRVVRQNTKLITAILCENVPLTNNLAERQLRPMVVARKISGGSRSSEGAKTHAVNMSIFQTIRMQDQPLVPTLKNLLLSSFTKN